MIKLSSQSKDVKQDLQGVINKRFLEMIKELRKEIEIIKIDLGVLLEGEEIDKEIDLLLGESKKEIDKY